MARQELTRTAKINYNMYDGDERVFTFKPWENYGKRRIYMKDYKGRTIGFIDRADERFELIDNNGLRPEKIEQVLDEFARMYRI